MKLITKILILVLVFLILISLITEYNKIIENNEDKELKKTSAKNLNTINNLNIDKK